MKLKELQQVDNSEFYEELITIDTWQKETIEKFFKKQVERVGLFGSYPYLLNYFYNELAIKKTKYIVIEIGNDRVILFFKKVSIFTAQYWRLVYYPISLENIRKNEEKVLKTLIDKKTIKQIHYIEQDRGKVDKIIDGQEQHIDYDFFVDLIKKEKEIDRAKFKSKHAINLCEKNKDFYCRTATIEDRDKILELHEYWKSQKTKVSKGIFNAFWKRFDENIENDNLIFLVYGYKNMLLGFSVFIRVMDKFSYEMIAQNHSIKKTTYTKEVENDKILKRILAEIGQVMFYFSLKKLISVGVKANYCAGSHDNDKGLLNFKKHFFGDCINYYRKTIKGS